MLAGHHSSDPVPRCGAWQQVEHPAVPRSRHGPLADLRTHGAEVGRGRGWVVALHLEEASVGAGHAYRAGSTPEKACVAVVPIGLWPCSPNGSLEEAGMGSGLVAMVSMAFGVLGLRSTTAKASLLRPGSTCRTCVAGSADCRTQLRRSWDPSALASPPRTNGAAQRICRPGRSMSALKLCHVFGANGFRDRKRLRVCAGQRLVSHVGGNVRFPRVMIPHPRT